MKNETKFTIQSTLIINKNSQQCIYKGRPWDLRHLGPILVYPGIWCLWRADSLVVWPHLCCQSICHLCLLWTEPRSHPSNSTRLFDSLREIRTDIHLTPVEKVLTGWFDQIHELTEFIQRMQTFPCLWPMTGQERCAIKCYLLWRI